MKQAGLLDVRGPARPRANDPLDEVSDDEEHQEDEEPGQLPTEPAHVFEEDVDRVFAAARRRASVPRDGGWAAVLTGAALDPPAAPGGFTHAQHAHRHEGAGGPVRRAARQHLQLDGGMDDGGRTVLQLCCCSPAVRRCAVLRSAPPPKPSIQRVRARATTF